MRRTWTRADLQGASLWWVASLSVGGRVYRWAESPLEVTSDDGDLAIAGGLQNAAISQVAPWMGGAPESRQVSLDLMPSAVGMNPASLLSSRYMLDRAPVEVALWRAGDAWEERQVLLQGLVVGYDWGGPDEVLTIEGEESAQQDRGLLPFPGAVVSSTTWPYAAPPAGGLYYPVILGAPGPVAATPALMVESTVQGGASDLLLVAGHQVSATSVTVYDGSAFEVLAVSTTTDGVGRVVSVVDLGTATTIAVDPTIAYQVGWASAGILAISGAAPATGAGSILEVVLAQSTLPVDRGSLASVRDALNSYLLGAFVQQQLSPFEWVTQAVLPLLPIAILTGPDGWRILPIPVTPTEADCQGSIQAGDGYTQAIRLDRARRAGFDEIANEIQIKYALDTQTNASSETALLSGAGWDGVAHTDLASQLSQQTYGRRVKSLETVAVYDSSTAYRILRWQSIAYAFSRSLLRYSLAQEYFFLRPGLVWVQDSVLQIDAAGWIQRLDFTTDGRVEVEIVIWSTP